MSSKLRKLDDTELDIPEFFDVYDVRKPIDLYIQDSLRVIITEIFEARKEVEKYMSRQELLAYDEILMDCLKHDNLMPKLRREIYKDFNTLEQQNQMYNQYEEGEKSQ